MLGAKQEIKIAAIALVALILLTNLHVLLIATATTPLRLVAALSLANTIVQLQAELAVVLLFMAPGLRPMEQCCLIV